MKARLPVSLVICSRERPRLLVETVESVLAGDTLPAEIVIVDQSARPNPALATCEPCEGVMLRYLLSRSAGLSRGRNLAIAESRHDIIAIIDDDMLVEAGWFRSLVEGLLAAGDRAVVTGRVLPGPEARAGGFVPALVSDPRPATYVGRLDNDVLAGGHMAAHRAAFAEVGGFDERLGAGSRFPAADDNDLGFRLLEAGYRIVYLPEAVVYHRAWRPQREYLPMRWRYGRGKGGFYAKHLLARRLARDVGRRGLAFPRRVLRDPRGAAGDVIYSLGILVGVFEWSLRRHSRDHHAATR